MDYVTVILISLNILDCRGASIRDQLEHLARRYNAFNQGQNSLILGAPGLPSHLPEAEPILPGHTLIRPALGMLKSAVKFPHRDWEGGAGVYGHINNLGISYAGTNERVLYTGFRRNGNDLEMQTEAPKTLLIILVKRANKKKEIHQNRYKKVTLLRQKRDKKRGLKKRMLFRNMQANGAPVQSPNKNSLHFGYPVTKLRKKKQSNRRQTTSVGVLSTDTSSALEMDDITPSKSNDTNQKLTWFYGTQVQY